VLKHDPHIDRFYIQDTDQVPNHALDAFWDWESKKYERWINLSESVEGALLALPGRHSHKWPHEMRHKYLNVNYAEFAADLAQVSCETRQRFYATPEEKTWARKERERFGGDFLVMYSLSGSSVHKVWPWMDHLFARLLVSFPNCRVVTVGDELSTLLERGWENESRIVKKSGKYTIRESMALLEQCDMVIGGETGMLNAAAMLDMPKVVFLSHSSRENLTKHWRNTYPLEPKNTKCFPCHRMHYTFDHCSRDEATGVATCQADIPLDAAWDAIITATGKKKVIPILEAA
jgi:ADP-heptose:LPS heptosyltransferase